MNRPMSFVLLVAGIVLIVYGVLASRSVGSDFSRLFTGVPTDTTLWLLAGGLVASVVGIAGLMRRSD